MDGYRDDRGAALERLARLEAAHETRAVERTLARLDDLRVERGKLDIRTRETTAHTIVRYAALFVGIFALRTALFHPSSGDGTLVVGGISVVTIFVSFVVARTSTSAQRERIRAIDAEMDALAAPHVRVAPSDLAEVHARIAELAGRDEADPLLDPRDPREPSTPPPRTPRSVGTSR